MTDQHAYSTDQPDIVAAYRQAVADRDAMGKRIAADLRTLGAVGGESGRGARPMHPDWARSLVDQCTSAGVPVFVKQMGSVIGPGKGGDWDLWPTDLRTREYPSSPLAVA